MHISMWKRALIVLVCLTALFFAMPNLFYNRVQQHNDALVKVHKTGTTTAAEKAAIDGWPSWLPSSIVNLGLDLRGGAYLLAEVQLKNVYVDRMNALWPEVRDALRKDRNTIGGVRRVQSPPGTLKVKIGNPQGMQEALSAIGKLATPVVSLTSVGEKDLAITQDGPDAITIQLSDAEKKATDERTVQQSLEIVRRRIDESGTREPTIQREGNDRILIEVPGISSAGELKKLIGTTAKLTFNQVIRQTSDKNANPGIGNELLPASDQPGVYYVVNATPVVSGGELTDAEPSFDQNGRPAVNFRFGPSGARQFGDYTAAHVGQPFAIVLDKKVISAPVINEAIRGGSGIITGNFTIESSTNLAVLLRAGALPTKLTFLEERTVGPTLGADSIAAGKLAAMVGTAAVMVFMVAVYGMFGWIANFALVLNMAMMFGVLSAIGGTLTLPGIAGIVLTVGMAVDANVLIYERIREELRVSKGPARAIELGYERALSAILDSNITTFMTAVILYWLGAGPVRGFAITLGLGILTSVFTAIYVTRLVIVLWFERRRPKTIVV
ncbi:preprotein translocase subunit SecD [Defluviimonas sp. 20V17]|uniref:Protein translocase subunit SecD n=1 Tax=Allgaiera indica TaxID=765699 RepID=A0AAN5A0G6_9RHOB|nr:protein translocase subunit SecD [Allgaiera indica]KDB01915.1 preprotein translocase subunit SecD [Defluviimonas sp. 20V17]GHE03418.1 protein translocase subunit SecD [Allgaiera indica]SDX25155.1 preprotein translocase subunit SecD [Allgaiera indica]